MFSKEFCDVSKEERLSSSGQFVPVTVELSQLKEDNLEEESSVVNGELSKLWLGEQLARRLSLSDSLIFLALRWEVFGVFFTSFFRCVCQWFFISLSVRPDKFLAIIDHLKGEHFTFTEQAYK